MLLVGLIDFDLLYLYGTYGAWGRRNVARLATLRHEEAMLLVLALAEFVQLVHQFTIGKLRFSLQV